MPEDLKEKVKRVVELGSYHLYQILREETELMIEHQVGVADKHYTDYGLACLIDLWIGRD